MFFLHRIFLLHASVGQFRPNWPDDTIQTKLNKLHEHFTKLSLKLAGPHHCPVSIRGSRCNHGRIAHHEGENSCRVRPDEFQVLSSCQCGALVEHPCMTLECWRCVLVDGIAGCDEEVLPVLEAVPSGTNDAVDDHWTLITSSVADESLPVGNSVVVD